MRTIVYTGKGGVGKTSVAAATALRCADLGYSTLVLSTDTAHSLGDSLQMELSPEPLPVTDNLDAQEIDVQYSMEKYWGAFQKFMIGLLSRRGTQEIIAEEVTILPGLEEGASLLWLNEYAESGAYDVVVLDAAPTAETLRLLSLPDVARWWVEKFIPFGRTAARISSAVGRPFGMDMVDPEAIATVERLFDTLDEVRARLSDSDVSSMRIVVNPERMVVKETQRVYTYLNLYGYPVDAVVANRIIPDEVSDPYFQAWKDTQRDNLELIQQAFDPLPQFRAPLFQTEMGGFDLLRRMADEIFEERDPAERLYEGKVQTLEELGDDRFILHIPLPFADKTKVDLYRSMDEITLQVASYKRNIVLPRALWGLEIQRAKLEDGQLNITFVPEEQLT